VLLLVIPHPLQVTVYCPACIPSSIPVPVTSHRAIPSSGFITFVHLPPACTMLPTSSKRKASSEHSTAPPGARRTFRIFHRRSESPPLCASLVSVKKPSRSAAGLSNLRRSASRIFRSFRVRRRKSLSHLTRSLPIAHTGQAHTQWTPWTAQALRSTVLRLHLPPLYLGHAVSGHAAFDRGARFRTRYPHSCPSANAQYASKASAAVSLMATTAKPTPLGRDPVLASLGPVAYPQSFRNG